jgi:hypothetical protein
MLTLKMGFYAGVGITLSMLRTVIDLERRAATNPFLDELLEQWRQETRMHAVRRRDAVGEESHRRQVGACPGGQAAASRRWIVRPVCHESPVGCGATAHDHAACETTRKEQATDLRERINARQTAQSR